MISYIYYSYQFLLLPITINYMTVVQPMNRLWKKIKGIPNSICLVDGFLIVFMAILFFYTIYHLLTGAASSDDTTAVGIIVRTSAASIFGYFISSNFTKKVSQSTTRSTNSPVLSVNSKSADTNSHLQNQIGFQAPSSPSNADIGNISFSQETSAAEQRCNKLQVIVVSGVGLFSLVILLISKQFPNITPELTAMISQLRDFVSACIGFLISCGKNAAD